MAAILTQIYYKEDQLSSLYPFAKPYFNENLTIFFENSVIADVVSKTEADKIAVCSWKLSQKMKTNIRRPRELTMEVMESDYDVLCFTGNTKYHQMLAAADKWHAGFKSTMKLLLELIGKQMPNEVKYPIYQNAFSARREIYQDYVNGWLLPAMVMIQTDTDLNSLAMVDSNYSYLSGNNNAEELRAKIGVPYYPMAPFLLERLFSIYVHNNKISVTWL